MAKKWSEVAASPEYQKLSDSDKEAARSQYFDEVVAPKVPKDQLGDVRAAFDADTGPKKRTSPLDHPDAGKEVVTDKRKPGPAGFWRTTPPQTDAEKRPIRAFVAGVTDPVVGAGQLAANIIPGTGVAKMANDYVAGREKELGAEGITPANGLRIVGNIASPINYLPVMRGAEAVEKMGMAGKALWSAGRGAASAVTTPTTGNDFWHEKLKQAEIGAIVGPAFEGATRLASGVIRSAADAVVPEIAKVARSVGYVMAPSMISKEPGHVANVLAGWSGKIKTQQAASAKNQEVTNGLVKKALGLGDEADLSADSGAFRAVREEAGKAYQAIKQRIPTIIVDEGFRKQISALGGAGSHAAKLFPEIYANADVSGLIKSLTTHQEFSTDVAMDLVKKLRFDAKANLKALDPVKHALGLSQREAAEHIDDLIDRNVVAASHLDRTLGREGQEGSLVQAYKDARKRIAQSYDVEAVTNPATGNVNARGLAKLQAKGKPLSGVLKTVADVAAAFPKAMQNESQFGGNEAHSAPDFFGSAMALAHGRPEIAGAILARPLARMVVLSHGFQEHMVNSPTHQMISRALPGLSGARDRVANALLDVAPYAGAAGSVGVNNALVRGGLSQAGTQ